MDKDGKFLALRVHTPTPTWALPEHLRQCRAHHPVRHAAGGPVQTPQVYVGGGRGSPTPRRSMPTGRRAGPRPPYPLERLVTRCAWEMGLSQDEIRKRNFITSFPYQTPVALQYDIGDYHACMGPGATTGRRGRLRARKAAAKAKGPRGIGYSSYIEACGIAPIQHRRRPGARAGSVRSGEVRAPHRQRDGVHRLAQPWPGA